MGLLGKSFATIGVAGLLYASYAGYKHWQAIKIFPAQTRKELRQALRAERDGRSGDAEMSFHEALQSCSRLTGEKSLATQSILLELAEFYRQRRRPDRAISIFESILQKTAGEEEGEGEELTISPRQRVEIQKALADLYSDAGRNEEAITLYKNTITQLMQQGSGARRDDSALAATYADLGNAQFSLERLNEALEAYEEAAKHVRGCYGEKSTEYLTMLNNIAACHFSSGKSAESLRSAKETAEVALSLAHRLPSDKTTRAIKDNLQSIISALQDPHS